MGLEAGGFEQTTKRAQRTRILHSAAEGWGIQAEAPRNASKKKLGPGRATTHDQTRGITGVTPHLIRHEGGPWDRANGMRRVCESHLPQSVQQDMLLFHKLVVVLVHVELLQERDQPVLVAGQDLGHLGALVGVRHEDLEDCVCVCCAVGVHTCVSRRAKGVQPAVTDLRTRAGFTRRRTMDESKVIKIKWRFQVVERKRNKWWTDVSFRRDERMTRTCQWIRLE